MRVIYIYIYIYIYIHIYIYIYISMFVFVSVSVCANVLSSIQQSYVCTHACMYMYMHIT
jgi:hypothetical protein